MLTLFSFVYLLSLLRRIEVTLTWIPPQHTHTHTIAFLSQSTHGLCIFQWGPGFQPPDLVTIASFIPCK